MDWDTIGFVKASTVRQNVMGALVSGPQSPKDLATTLDLHFPQVSQALRELRERGLVKLLTEGRTKGRVYAITKQGSDILEQI